MLAAAACGFERLRGKDEEAAGEERNHREDVEVHTVSARRIGARLLQAFDRCRVNAGWQQRLDLLDEGRTVRTLGQANVQAVELAQAAEAPLRRRDVDERRLAAQRRRR